MIYTITTNPSLDYTVDADLVPGETACVCAMVAAPPAVSHIRKGLDLVKVRAVDETGVLDVTFFNQSWLKNSLRPGETYIFCGRAEGTGSHRKMVSPVVEPEGRREVTGRIVPVYPLTAGVSQLVLSRSIRQGLDACAASPRAEQYVQALLNCGADREAEILKRAKELADSDPDYEDEAVDAEMETLCRQTALNQDYESFWGLVRLYIARSRERESEGVPWERKTNPSTPGTASGCGRNF